LASGDMVSFFAMRPWVAEPFWSDTSLIDSKINRANFALLDLFQEGAIYFPSQNPRKILEKLLYESNSWGVLGVYDGIMVLERGATPSLPWSLQAQSALNSAECSGGIVFSRSFQPHSPAQLLCVRFSEESHNPHLLHTEFVWQVISPEFADSMPITTIGAWIPEGERFPHFPIWAYTLSHPVETREIIVERMTWKIHETSGCYPISTGLYLPNSTVYPITQSTNLLGRRWESGALQVTQQGVEWVENCGKR